MQAGRSLWTIVFSTSMARAVLMVSPRSRAVPVIRLVNIMSSESNKPIGAAGSLSAMLYRLRPTFARSDANAVVQRQDKDLAVADASLRPGSPGFHNGIHCWLHEILVHR